MPIRTRRVSRNAIATSICVEHKSQHFSVFDRLLLQLRLEPFHQLLRDVNNLLLRLYDAFLLGASLQPRAPPAVLIAQVCAPSSDASGESQQAWQGMVERVNAIRHAQDVPASFRAEKFALPTE